MSNCSDPESNLNYGAIEHTLFEKKTCEVEGGISSEASHAGQERSQVCMHSFFLYYLWLPSEIVVFKNFDYVGCLVFIVNVRIHPSRIILIILMASLGKKESFINVNLFSPNLLKCCPFIHLIFYTQSFFTIAF